MSTWSRNRDGHYLYISKTWLERLIRSANFKKPEGHQNSGAILYESAFRVTDTVTLGAFTLPSSLVGQVDHFETLL